MVFVTVITVIRIRDDTNACSGDLDFALDVDGLGLQLTCV